MLKAASIVLAERCVMLTSVASTKDSLNVLEKHIAVPYYFPLALNWNSSDFLNAISNHVRKQGCPTLVLAWLHRQELGAELAHALSLHSKNEIDLFQVLGSAAADPSQTVCSDTVSVPSNIKYHRVILGFKVEKKGPRWLTDSEISTGVISAIDSNDEISTVGKVTPWSERP